MAAQLARGLRAEGDTVAIAAGAGEFDRLIAGLGVRRYEFEGRGRSIIPLASAALTVRNAIAELRPDVVHAHNVKATAITGAGLLPRRRCVPLLTTFHGVAHGRYPAASRILRAASLVACVSEQLEQRLLAHGFPPERLRRVRNAVEIPSPLSAEAGAKIDAELNLGGAPVISIVGRLVTQKAHERFLEAAALITAQKPEVRFLIVGEGPRRRALETMAEGLALSQVTVFTGLRADARELIARSQLIVFSSDWEGMPVVALEALAAGVPVVSTDVEGMRELLANDAGLIVKRSAAALADGVVGLLDSPRERERMGYAGRRRVATEYSIDAMVSAYRRIYAELVTRSESESA